MLVIVLILIFRYPLGKYYLSGQAENPYKAETMGIPRGVIRGVLTLTILFGAVILQVFIVNSESPVERIAPFMTAFEIMLGFYFGSKVVHHLTSADKNKVKAVAKEGGAKKEEFYDPEATG
jgi:hypothetical protein